MLQSRLQLGQNVIHHPVAKHLYVFLDDLSIMDSLSQLSFHADGQVAHGFSRLEVAFADFILKRHLILLQDGQRLQNLA